MSTQAYMLISSGLVYGIILFALVALQLKLKQMKGGKKYE